MAERRMFAKTIIDSDAFIEMPTSTRLLYFDLGMRADDDGFINSPKKIIRMTGASEDDLKILITKKFVIPFENGIVVIKHWKIHNYIRSDRYIETKYKEQKALLSLDENNAYTLSTAKPPVGIPDDNQLVGSRDTQDRLGKDRLGKDRLGKEEEDETPLPPPPKAPKEKVEKIHFAEFVTMTNDEYEKLIITHGKEFADQCIERLDNYKGSSGNKYKSDYRAILSWVVDDVKKKNYSQAINGKPSMAYTNPNQTEFNDLDRFYSNLKE